MQTVRRIWRWWYGELRNVLPEWAQIAFLGETKAVRLEFRDSAAEVSLEKGRARAPTSLLHSKGAALVPHSGRKIVVDAVLPSEKLLARQIEAPVKAAGRLQAIAELDLKRNTPFPDGSTLWVLGSSKRDGETIRVTQWVAKRSDVEMLRSRLQEVGLVVRKVLVPGDKTEISLIDYSSSISPHSKRWRLANGFIVSATAALLLATWLQPGWVARQEIRSLEDDLAELRTSSVALRRDVEQRRSDQERATEIDGSISERARLIEAIRQATVALPDAAWISAASFQLNSLALSGETSEAAVDLITRFGESRAFSNPRLSGPITRTQTGGEKFELVTNLRAAR